MENDPRITKALELIEALRAELKSLSDQDCLDDIYSHLDDSVDILTNWWGRPDETDEEFADRMKRNI